MLANMRCYEKISTTSISLNSPHLDTTLPQKQLHLLRLHCLDVRFVT